MTRAGRVALLLCLALAVAACASRREPAPVIERLPSSKAPAKPGAAPAPAPAPSLAADGYYIVKRGDTLYSIALEHGADYRDMAQWNGIDDPAKLRVGQQLRVRPPEERAAPGVQVGTARGPGRIEARPLEGGAAPQAQAPADGRPRTEPKAEAKPESRPEAKPEARAEAGALEFVWPAKGKVIGTFAEPRSKGIDIDGKLGDPIVAAAAGRVTYIGSGIPGLGKLVVIKHESGFITVYAHNREILVKEQQAVTRGQKIAELGASDSDRPKLHFQIRKGSAAVDPLKYLPSS